MIAEAVFVATAYSWGCGAGDLSRIERPPVPMFTVAVDPTIIPLGMALEIEAPFIGKRIWRAEDTGPDIVGNRIDLMMGDCEKAQWWGRREVKVRLRKDLGWEKRLSKRSALIAERLVSMRGSANLRARLSSVSTAEAQAARRSATLPLSEGEGSVAYRRFNIHAEHSSLLAWAVWATR